MGGHEARSQISKQYCCGKACKTSFTPGINGRDPALSLPELQLATTLDLPHHMPDISAELIVHLNHTLSNVFDASLRTLNVLSDLS